MTLVSVIVPTFNRELVLLRALESVVKQTYSNWELIVVDDVSTDATKKTFANWAQKQLGGQKIEFLSTGSNSGVSRARNLGARHARGSWLAFLDSDDEWLPNKLNLQMAMAGKFRWIHGEEIWIRDGRRTNAPQRYKKYGGRIFRECADVCFVGASTVAVERCVFEQCGGFREDFPVCEDYDLWLKLAARHEAGFVTEPVIKKYGGHAGQLSTLYAGMNSLRVRSLNGLLDNAHISEDERRHIHSAIAEKSKHGTTFLKR